MKSIHIILLFSIGFISLTNAKPEQQLPDQNENDEEVDRLWKRHTKHQAASNQSKTGTPNYNAEKMKARFTPEFTKILLAAAPASLKDKLKLLQSSECPEDKKPRLLLLYGPSGSGKTTLAELFAVQTQRKYVRINASSLGTELVNSAKSNFIKSIEDHLNGPCVIVLDEIDAVIKEATSSHDPEKKVPQQFWTLLDELAQNPNVIIIGTTNDISNLPSQVKTRFADALIEVPDAKPEIKKDILLYYVTKHPNNCDDGFLKKLANNCKNLSIREIEKIVKMGWDKAFLRNPSSISISKKDLEDSVRELKNKVNSMQKKEKSRFSKNIEKFEEGGCLAAGLAIGGAVTCKIAEYYGFPCFKK